jgi:hypothetical protein
MMFEYGYFIVDSVAALRGDWKKFAVAWTLTLSAAREVEAYYADLMDEDYVVLTERGTVV